MDEFTFYLRSMLLLLFLLPVLVFFFWAADARRKCLLSRFVEQGLLGRIRMSANVKARWYKRSLFLLAITFVVIALARPAWNRKPEKVSSSGRDVVFVLDVSRSMLAEDLKPNRLERAKLAIRDCLEGLEGDRVGLIVFAGVAEVRCPLTLDYGFFRMMLDSVQPGMISRGGTMIGDAIRKAMDDVLPEYSKGFKDILLITDGEDHESFPVEAAEEAGENGTRIIAVGLGDPHEGKRIPITGAQGNKTYLKHNGQEVWTKLDAATLTKMAEASDDGRYLPVKTGTIDLRETYQDLIASAERRQLEAETMRPLQEKFQIFILIALILLFGEIFVSERREVTLTSSQSVENGVT